jgi:cytochrome b
VSAPGPATAWDLPTRVFHWALAVLVVFSFTTGKIGGPWLEWHMKSGYAILALLLFRVAWGFAGPANARFTAFVLGPAAALGHARDLVARRVAAKAGHTPLGGWMVLVMLAVLALQAATGLFTNDESSHEGPLSRMVSNAMIDRMSVIHGWNQWVVATVVGVHVAAIVYYHAALKANVTRGMVSGPAHVPLRAWVLLAAAAGAVYYVVVVVPRPA